jgi:hypothetical protein
MESNMNSPSYEKLKKEEQELEQLKGKTYTLEDKVCEIMKEVLAELEVRKVKTKPKKRKENSE